MSLREEAKRLGVNAIEMSNIEHGREPYTDAGRTALAKRIKEIETQI
jgi:hypothetical protein